MFMRIIHHKQHDNVPVSTRWGYVWDLIVESTEECHTPLNPVKLGLRRGHLYSDHVIGGVSSGRQCSYANKYQGNSLALLIQE